MVMTELGVGVATQVPLVAIEPVERGHIISREYYVHCAI